MGKRIGYARVSTDDQNLDLQRDALLLAGCSDIYEETISGKSVHRPELDHCLKALRSADTLVVWRLDRLGRSLADLVHIVRQLEAAGVGFESITERIETTSAAGRLIFHVFAALAEFERNLIRERTKAGLAAARARGRKGGRKPSLDPQQIREIRALLRDPDIQVVDVASRYGVSRTTLYRHVGAFGHKSLKPTRKWSDNAPKAQKNVIKSVSVNELEIPHADI
ncbi:MAG: recombinase family protein [Pseudomonas sp.]